MTSWGTSRLIRRQCPRLSVFFLKICCSEAFSSVGHVRHVGVCGCGQERLRRYASWCAVLGFDDPAQAFACGG